MRFTTETVADGVSQRSFTVGDLAGAFWAPPGEPGGRPVVLLAHGGGRHKTAPGILARARYFVTNCGFAAVAIDAPGHGDRPRPERIDHLIAQLRGNQAAGEPVGPVVARLNAECAALAVPEWRSVLDALDVLGCGPAGFWGLSLGSAIGFPLVATEPRIAAAVLGLAPGLEALGDVAGKIGVPVQFLLQWDDEFVPRETGLAIFDALASKEKTLHANTGGHSDVPRFETDASARFFARHLIHSGPA